MRSVVVRGAVAWATLSSWSSSSSWGVVGRASSSSSSSSSLVRRGRPTFRPSVVLSLPRGGESLADAHDDDEYDDEDEYEDDEDEDEVVVAEEEEDDEEEEESYDEMLVPSPMSSMGVTVGVMMFTKRLDLTDTKVIRRIRAAYLVYVIVCQVFYAYARLAARAVDDRSRVTVSNPLTELVRDKLGDASSSSSSSSSPTTAAAKSVADRLLRSETTVVEYDVGKARKSSAGMLTGLIFTWFLHFKMNQVQPLLFQTASGLLNLYFDPLFQIYARGRRLRRPFAPPPSPLTPPSTKTTSTDAEKDDDEEEGTMVEEEEEEETDDDDDDEEVDDDEDDDEEVDEETNDDEEVDDDEETDDDDEVDEDDETDDNDDDDEEED